MDELVLLDRLRPHVGGGTGAPARYLFSRTGFTDRLAARARAEDDLHLVPPAATYR